MAKKTSKGTGVKYKVPENDPVDEYPELVPTIDIPSQDDMDRMLDTSGLTYEDRVEGDTSVNPLNYTTWANKINTVPDSYNDRNREFLDTYNKNFSKLQAEYPTISKSLKNGIFKNLTGVYYGESGGKNNTPVPESSISYAIKAMIPNAAYEPARRLWDKAKGETHKESYYTAPPSQGPFQQKELSVTGKKWGLSLEGIDNQFMAAYLNQMDNLKELREKYPEMSEEDLIEATTLSHNTGTKWVDPEDKLKLIKDKTSQYVNKVRRKRGTYKKNGGLFYL